MVLERQREGIAKAKALFIDLDRRNPDKDTFDFCLALLR